MGFLLKSDISSQQELCQLVNYNKIVTLEIFFLNMSYLSCYLFYDTKVLSHSN